MARVIVSIRVMPAGPNTDIEKLKNILENKITEFGGEVGKIEIEPIAFGLKALKLMFIMDESSGGTEILENEIVKIPGVNSAEVTDVRRAIG